MNRLLNCTMTGAQRFVNHLMNLVNCPMNHLVRLIGSACTHRTAASACDGKRKPYAACTTMRRTRGHKEPCVGWGTTP